MSKQDLIPLNKRSPEEARAIQSAGGKVRSAKKSLAAKIRGLKWVRGKNKPKAIQKVIDLLISPEISAFELIRYSEVLKQEPLTTNQRIVLLTALTNLHKAVHPTKIKVVIGGDEKARNIVADVFSGKDSSEVLDNISQV